MRNLVFVLVSLIASFAIAQCPKESIIQLIEVANQLKSQLVQSYWQEWSEVEMPILQIDDDSEFLFNTQSSDTTFHQSCENYLSRPTSLNKSLLATFPLVDGQPTIVVGTPENTGKSPEAWTVTLLHEHFHQLQFSHPNYYTAQKALQLDNGDQTGMWMLNYPFPYDQKSVNTHLKAMATNLLRLDSLDPREVLLTHNTLKRQLRDKLGEEHYKYLNLQVWQEGYARFVELDLTQKWIENFDQIKQNQFQLEEILTLQQQQEEEYTTHLEKSSPMELKRVYFYALGAAEANLINEVNPQWKSAYFDSLFTTDHLLKTVD